jgi:hypothetical protein
MNLLEYKVAWIDDQPKSAEGFYQRLSSFVGRYGFQLKVDWISHENELNAFLNSLDTNSDYDLILVDWKLGAVVKVGESGATVARDIRYRNPPSYVVFYSSDDRSNLMALIAGESIDGVYCVNRQHFVTETTEVIKASIRRFQDVETMRGVFLSAVASFDSIVSQALLKGFEGLPATEQRNVIDGLLGRVEKFHAERLDEIKKVDKGLELPKMLGKLKAGSSQELSCLIDLLSLANPSVNYQTSLERLKAYQKGFLPGRNDLAHVEESTDGDQSVVARSGRVWNPADLGQYRQEIVDHHDNLIYVRDALINELLEHLTR